MCDVYDVWLQANNDYELIKSAVTSGGRPSLDAITGPTRDLSSLKSCIVRCWHEIPNERPSFHGKWSQCVLLK